MTKLYYWLKIVYLSLKWVFRINLGDRVTLKTDKWPHSYTVINGVSPGTWKLKGFRDGEEVFHALRIDCQKIWTWQNCVGSFKSGYRFFMGYWFRIWCENGIEPWVRKCNIW